MRRLLLAFACLVLVACGQDETLPELPPAEILARSAETMNTLDGFHFVIDRDGALAYLDSSKTIAFSSGEGDYVAPDKARGIFKIVAPGFITEVSVISVGEIQWETNVVTGVWSELPPDWGFNPTVIFDPDIGLQAILVEDTSDLALGEPERLEDHGDQLLYQVSGNVLGERTYTMSGTLIGPDDLTFSAWVDPETFELVRIVVDEPAAEEDEDGTVWQLDFSDFGRIVTIEPPTIESE